MGLRIVITVLVLVAVAAGGMIYLAEAVDAPKRHVEKSVPDDVLPR